ncbi:hypothetical protein EDB87DRAFT_1321575 [Lactarius vividus]|nr:hypothetical protein EDB87DRAFT_1321575 [Lactarius vividus]
MANDERKWLASVQTNNGALRRRGLTQMPLSPTTLAAGIVNPRRSSGEATRFGYTTSITMLCHVQPEATIHITNKGPWRPMSCADGALKRVHRVPSFLLSTYAPPSGNFSTGPRIPPHRESQDKKLNEISHLVGEAFIRSYPLQCRLLRSAAKQLLHYLWTKRCRLLPAPGASTSRFRSKIHRIVRRAWASVRTAAGSAVPPLCVLVGSARILAN